MVDPLTKLLKHHPGIRYDISSSSFESIVQQLRSGSIDVALEFDAAFSDWSDIHREPAGVLSVTLFVRKGHPLLQGDLISMADLANYDFLAPSDSRPYGDIVRHIYEDQNVEWQTRVHKVDYFPLVRRFVATSNAIGIATLAYSQTEDFRARFDRVPGVDPWPLAPVCCARRARWEPKPAVRAFIATMTRSTVA